MEDIFIVKLNQTHAGAFHTWDEAFHFIDHLVVSFGNDSYTRVRERTYDKREEWIARLYVMEEHETSSVDAYIIAVPFFTHRKDVAK